MKRVQAHVRITGRVQGVYFRAATAQEARASGIDGWVRNVGDDVEAVFEGPRQAVHDLVEWCRTGPARAVVEHVETRWTEPEGITGFRIRS